MRDFELKVICHTESMTDPVDFSKLVHVTLSGMILLLYMVLGSWGTIQCVGIGGEKEMWSKKIKKKSDSLSEEAFRDRQSEPQES